nr:transposase, mutator type [Tanacetum cinerariifolium]
KKSRIIGVDANNVIYPVAYVIVETKSKASWCWFLNLLGEDLGTGYNFNPIFNFNCPQGLIQAIAYVFPSAEHRKWELTGIPCKHVMAAIYNMSKNSMGVGIPELWVHAAYRLKTWSHVYSFKINLCNGREMWPVIESTIVIIPPDYKPQVGRSSNKRKKSSDEIASERVKVVQVKLVVLVNLVQDKLLVQGMSMGKLLVQEMPQVKLVVLINPMQHQAQQAKD